MGDVDYSLVLPFDSDLHEFVRGVQVGMMYQALADGAETSLVVYADNAEMIARLQERYPGRLRVIIPDWSSYPRVPSNTPPTGPEWLTVEIGTPF